MLRVKKVSDAIFSRDFSKTMQSYINIFRDNFSRIKNVQISNIIKHYESKLLSIKNCIEEVEYSKKAKHEPGTDLVFKFLNRGKDCKGWRSQFRSVAKE